VPRERAMDNQPVEAAAVESPGTTPLAECPNCFSGRPASFYAVDDIPVHSCLLLEGLEEAVTFPTGRLELGCCPGCGFITNRRFDPATRSYSSLYEETQGFSGRFNTFLVGVVRELIDRYDIRSKTVLEIGCGKGDFLSLLCELGDNRGIGVDPACVPERIRPEVANRLTVITDYYGPRYADLKADVICCRHTLEHIPDPGRFLATVRETIGDRGDVLVFFEVPDVLRVLKEGAFWDLYYEHCSYFTPGSLARLFRATGFDLDSLYLDYDGQYVMLTAWPTDGPTQPRLDAENDGEIISRAVKSFRTEVQEVTGRWRELLGGARRRGERTVLWGSGSKAVSFLTTLGVGEEVSAVVDINPYRQGKYMPGTTQRIIAPAELKTAPPDRVIIMNPIYREEITRDLAALGLHPELLAV